MVAKTIGKTTRFQWKQCSIAIVITEGIFHIDIPLNTLTQSLSINYHRIPWNHNKMTFNRFQVPWNQHKINWLVPLNHHKMPLKYLSFWMCIIPGDILIYIHRGMVHHTMFNSCLQWVAIMGTYPRRSHLQNSRHGTAAWVARPMFIIMEQKHSAVASRCISYIHDIYYIIYRSDWLTHHILIIVYTYCLLCVVYIYTLLYSHITYIYISSL